MNWRSGAARVASVLEAAAIAVVIAAALFFAVRPRVVGLYDVMPTGPRAALVYLALGGLLVLLISRLRRISAIVPRLIAGTLAASLAVILVLAVDARASMAVKDARATEHWPPRIADTIGTDLRVLSSPLRASWGAWIAAHLRTGVDARTDASIPAEWPFPPDVQLAFETDERGTSRVWSRASDGYAVCVTIPHTQPRAADASRCEDLHAAPESLTFVTPARHAEGVPARHITVSATPWTQYRGDGARSGVGHVAPSSTGGWALAVEGHLRASGIATGDLVLIGSHGTGTLTAIDARTGNKRWVARLPNWVHQDPVTDGGIVVVGFGDNDDSFQGRAPSGVAAFVLATGERLWTRFDESSVMTSPVVHDSAVVYSSAIGWLRKRSLSTGELQGERFLPGAVVMAPPAATGDTIVFGLDYNGACALLMSSLETLWCRTFPHLRMMGHAAPAIGGGHVIVSGSGTALTPSLAEFVSFPRGLKRRLIESALFPKEIVPPSGQVFASIALADGRVEWVSPLFANPRHVEGHTAGTAVIVGDIGVIVLPIADTVVSFDLQSGAVRWTAGAHGARGPALVANGRVVVAGRDGVIEVRDLARGALICTAKRPVGWDRAGPVMAGSLLVFGDLKGKVEAMPERDLGSCGAP